MKIIISIFLVLTGLLLCAQNRKTEAIYNQILQIDNKLLCDKPESNIELIENIELLSSALNEMKYQLEEELKTDGNKTYNTISAGFPTDEELKHIEKLTEKEQIAFWAKIEAGQTQTEKAIASNLLKFQNEKDSLLKTAADYHEELRLHTEAFLEVHYAAMKVLSDRRKEIYDNYMENDSLSNYGKQQIVQSQIHFCASVSPSMLNKIKFERNHLKQNISLHKRMIIIELMEYSLLSEDEVLSQNAALLELNDVEILSMFIDSYKTMFDVLPGYNGNKD
jgi:hypothetical protein